MKRRSFIKLIGGAIGFWPVTARAQRPASRPVVGFIHSGFAEPNSKNMAAFRKGLSEAGYTEGRNVDVEYHWADGHYERLPAMAAELVDRKVTVIAVAPTSAAVVAKAATTTIPIVFEGGADPVELGVVTNLNHPGGNITGICNSANGLLAKRLELLREVVPKAERIGVLVDPRNPASTKTTIADARTAATALGLQVVIVEASSVDEIERAFVQKFDAIVASGDQYFVSLRDQIAASATRHALPTIHEIPDFAEAGGLMSYGSDLANAYHLTGGYVARVLKGDRPGDLPVQMAVAVRLVINLKTAKNLGLNIPSALLGRADAVIE